MTDKCPKCGAEGVPPQDYYEQDFVNLSAIPKAAWKCGSMDDGYKFIQSRECMHFQIDSLLCRAEKAERTNASLHEILERRTSAQKLWEKQCKLLEAEVERLRGMVGKLPEVAESAIGTYHLEYTEPSDGTDDSLTLGDVLTPSGETSIAKGMMELALLQDHVAGEMEDYTRQAVEGE